VVLCLTVDSNHEDDEVDTVRIRLKKLLKKQEPIEDYFTRLGVSHGKSNSFAAFGISLFLLQWLCLLQTNICPLAFQFFIPEGFSSMQR
jgi:hypothetical protein